ncbi:MAG: DMT family transporter [Kofleriaceae bacterium]
MSATRPAARSTHRAALALAAAAASTGAPLARWAAPTPSLVIAGCRTAFAAAALALVGARELPALARLSWRDRARVLAASALLAAHFGTWIASLAWTSTAASVALVSTSPAFAALFARFSGDVVTRREWTGIAIAAAGSALLTGGDWRADGVALLGDGLALLGAACAAGYLLVGRQLRGRVPLTPYLAAVNALAALLLAATCALTGVAALPATATAWLAVALAGLVASAGGHTLLNFVVRVLPAHLVALASLGEALGSPLLTWAAFGEVPPWYGVAGGVVVVAGIAVGFVRPAPTAP